MTYVSKVDGTKWQTYSDENGFGRRSRSNDNNIDDEARNLVNDDLLDCATPWRINIVHVNNKITTRIKAMQHDPFYSYVNGYVLRTDDVFHQMKRIWYLILYTMQKEGVTIPVLLAIGCGAFRGPFAQVPLMWARALRTVIETSFPFGSQNGFENIIVCFPALNPGDHYNYRCFDNCFHDIPQVALLEHSPRNVCA